MSQSRTASSVTAQIRLPDQSAVLLSGVSARSGGQMLLTDLDLTIPRNVCFGIAGGSPPALDALAEVVATRRRTMSGSVHVVGFDAAHEPDEIRRRLGYLPFPHTVPSGLRVDEYLTIQAAAMGVPRDGWEALVDTLLTLVGIAGRQRVFTHELTPGSRQLLAVAATLVHDPTVVVLREPTDGLDARARTRLWNMLHRLVDVSRTIVVCSRHLSELSTGCADVAVLDGGRIVDHGAPTDVVGRLGGARRVRARLANGAVRTHTVPDEAAQAALLRKLVLADVDLVEFAEVAPELDDLHLPGTAASATDRSGSPGAAPTDERTA